jgi:hypothetical protein
LGGEAKERRLPFTVVKLWMEGGLSDIIQGMGHDGFFFWLGLEVMGRNWCGREGEIPKEIKCMSLSN